MLPFRESPPTQLPSTDNLVSARLPHLPDKVNAAGPWAQPETLRQSQSSRLRKNSSACTPLIRTLLSLPRRLFRTSSCPRLLSSSQPLSNHATAQRTGTLGMRAERWHDFGEQAGDSNLFVQVVVHVVAPAVPHSVLQYLRSGQVTPLAKPTGGHRPLLMMSFLCRFALKSVMAA